jgi:hypothetical protein
MLPFLIESLRAALAAAGDTPARQLAIHAVKEDLVLRRGEMLTVGPQPELSTDEAKAANLAFRAQLDEISSLVSAMLGEFSK